MALMVTAMIAATLRVAGRAAAVTIAEVLGG